LKVVLLAYSRGLISSRKIEQACRENVVFIALACGQQPDHSTIAAFVSSMKDEILPLFGDVLLVCEEMNLLGDTMFALDGCKLPSNASKEWSGTFPELQKKKQKIEAKVAQLLAEQIQADRGQDEPSGPRASGSNRQQQVEKLQKKAELIDKWLAENQPKLGVAGRERQSNITDNDSATMMISHGVVQGYNSQALIDGKHRVIVHGEAFGNGQDHIHVPPMLEGTLAKTYRALATQRSALPGRSSLPTAITILKSIYGSARSSGTGTRGSPLRSVSRPGDLPCRTFTMMRAWSGIFVLREKSSSS
jgi:hypothetical protein